MHDPTIHSSSFDLAPTGSRRLFMWLGIIAGLAVLGGGAFIVIKLMFAEPGDAACDHFDSLAAKESQEHRAELVDMIERKVESSVMAYGLVGKERVEVTGCRGALRTLDKAMPHGQFTRVTKCIETARTAAGAAICF